MSVLSSSTSRERGNRPARVFRARSLAARAGVAIIIGALCTVGAGAVGVWRHNVAMNSPLTRAAGQGFVRDSAGRAWEWVRWECPAATRWQFIHMPRADLPGQMPSAEEYEAALSRLYGAETASEEERGTLAMMEPYGLTNYAMLDRLDVGWPVAAFRLVDADYVSGIAIVGGKVLRGIDLRSGSWPDWVSSLAPCQAFGVSMFPTSPILPGAFVSLGLWGGACFAMLTLPRLVRAAWRRRHHRCLYCGYDLSATSGACPECGFSAWRPASG